MTIREDSLLQICEEALYFVEKEYNQKQEAKIIGISMEGPFICAAKKDAQNEDYIRKFDLELYHDMQNKYGKLIKLVDIAPELEGAMEFIKL